jgi:hypothetical protein
VQLWNIVDGPREYEKRGSLDIDVGWVWEISRGGELRSVRVEVAGGRLNEPGLPEECQRAIRDRGRSALAMHLDENDPPARIVVTSVGLLAEPE